jgi:hypothetical protein
MELQSSHHFLCQGQQCIILGGHLCDGVGNPGVGASLQQELRFHVESVQFLLPVKHSLQLHLELLEDGFLLLQAVDQLVEALHVSLRLAQPVGCFLVLIFVLSPFHNSLFQEELGVLQ